MSVPVVTPDQCAASMGTREDGQICAGGSSGRDACQAWMCLSVFRQKSEKVRFQGDGGGPLTFKQSNGQHILIGTVSSGNSCGQVGPLHCLELYTYTI